MTRLQNTKRPLPDKTSPTAILSRVKRGETRSESELEAWASWEYPPEFWDRLSKVELTPRALRELDRRKRARCARPSPLSDSDKLILPRTTIISAALARFSRQGGPDLRALRGYPNSFPHVAMKTGQPLRTEGAVLTVDSTLSSSKNKTRKPPAYDREFCQHLTDHNIYETYSSQRPDLTEVMAALAVRRPSLSLSDFSKTTFKTLQQEDERAKDEADLLDYVMPIILGSTRIHASAKNTVFGNLEHLTDGTIAAAKPDIYYGADPEQLSRSIRRELGPYLVPSTTHDKPLVPNLFIEAKGPNGSLSVAMRQARYDGAIGARGMHRLQNYGKEEEKEVEYDNYAYTFSSIYHGGVLKLYAHHLTAPITKGGRPGYHMTLINGWYLTGSTDMCLQGLTAFRNARDLAKRYRDKFIQAANEKREA